MSILGPAFLSLKEIPSRWRCRASWITSNSGCSYTYTHTQTGKFAKLSLSQIFFFLCKQPTTDLNFPINTLNGISIKSINNFKKYNVVRYKSKFDRLCASYKEFKLHWASPVFQYISLYHMKYVMMIIPHFGAGYITDRHTFLSFLMYLLSFKDDFSLKCLLSHQRLVKQFCWTTVLRADVICRQISGLSPQ